MQPTEFRVVQSCTDERQPRTSFQSNDQLLDTLANIAEWYGYQPDARYRVHAGQTRCRVYRWLPAAGLPGTRVTVTPVAPVASAG